jgi:hypothetical protein
VAVVLHVGAVVVAETRHVDAHRLSIIREVLDILWTKNTQCTVILWNFRNYRKRNQNVRLRIDEVLGPPVPVVFQVF